MHLVDFAVSGVQVFVYLEPVELKLFPEVLALLIHYVRYALNVVFLLFHILSLLLTVIVIGRPPFPQVAYLVDLHTVRVSHLCPQEVLDLFLKLLLFLLLST